MFLTIKKIPKVSWSSEKPLILKPKLKTFFFLCFGLSLFGIGEGLLLVSYTGASPWSVLAQGISLNIDYSIGLITFFISLFVIFLWVFLSQKPGIGSILNAVIIALMIDVCLKYVLTPDHIVAKILLAFLIEREGISFSFLSKGLQSRKNAIHSNFLSRIFSNRKNSHRSTRCCNIAFFKQVCININGFNNEFECWGREDSEFVVRLINNGLNRKNLRFNAIQYHLWHKVSDRKYLDYNNQLLQNSIEYKLKVCKKGINKYI